MLLPLAVAYCFCEFVFCNGPFVVDGTQNVVPGIPQFVDSWHHHRGFKHLNFFGVFFGEVE